VELTPVGDAGECERSIIARSQMAGMLKDSMRCTLYSSAVGAAVQALGGAPRVLDIGAGTGLLALLAHRAGAGEVTACEQFPALAAVARSVVADNCGGGVRVHACHSGDLQQPPSAAAQLLVSEIVDSALLGEGIIPALRDAYARLALPSAASVPQSAHVFAQLVFCPTLCAMQDSARAVLRHGEPQAHPRGAALMYSRQDWAPVCPATLPPFPVRPSRVPLQRLSEPFCAMKVDFTSAALGPGGSSAQPPADGGPEDEVVHPRIPPLPGSESSSASGACPGANAVLMWWRLKLWEGVGEYDSSQEVGPRGEWQDHWLPMLHPLPTPCPSAPGGQGWTVVASRTATSIHFFVGLAGAAVWPSKRAYNLHKRALQAGAGSGGSGAGSGDGVSGGDAGSPPEVAPPLLFTEPGVCCCGLHGGWTPLERLWALCCERTGVMGALRAGVAACLSSCSAATSAGHARPLRVLDLSEGALGGLLAATATDFTNTKVFSLNYGDSHTTHVGAIARQCGVQVLFLPTKQASEVTLAMLDAVEREEEEEEEVEGEEGEEGEEEEGGGVVGGGSSPGCVSESESKGIAAAASCGGGQQVALQPLDALVSEPYIAATALHPLATVAALWRRVHSVRPLLAPGAPILPSRAQVFVQAVRIPSLYTSSRFPVGTVQGFSHAALDSFVGTRWAECALPLPLYQYHVVPVGGAQLVLTADFSTAPGDCRGAFVRVGDECGGAQAVVAWVVWELAPGVMLDMGAGRGGWGVNAPNPHRQALYFLKEESGPEGVQVWVGMGAENNFVVQIQGSED
jgi:hypothetical protein